MLVSISQMYPDALVVVFHFVARTRVSKGPARIIADVARFREKTDASLIATDRGFNTGLWNSANPHRRLQVRYAHDPSLLDFYTGSPLQCASNLYQFPIERFRLCLQFQILAEI